MVAAFCFPRIPSTLGTGQLFYCNTAVHSFGRVLSIAVSKNRKLYKLLLVIRGGRRAGYLEPPLWFIREQLYGNMLFIMIKVHSEIEIRDFRKVERF